ncbi:MAG: TIGR00282 family metallophosphoesterase [Chloroflexi bacterium]|nr:TIGR00282 family metallophosphoesterase [Chloroflexota bacterium]
MRILMTGDVVGKPGRRAISKLIPALRSELGLDFVIANGENSAAGLGLTPDTAQELYEAGVDVITTGNHAWAKKEIFSYLESEMPLVRPLNYPPQIPGRGFCVHRDVMVVQVSGRVFMTTVDDPFRSIDQLLESYANKPKIIIVDAHTEATSEIGGLGWFLDGRVSAVLGTHTHVGTVDTKVLPKGTAFVSDIGMVGPRDSIIGNAVDAVLERFATALYVRLSVADGPISFNSVLLEIDDETGRAISIERVDREVD